MSFFDHNEAVSDKTINLHSHVYLEREEISNQLIKSI